MTRKKDTCNLPHAGKEAAIKTRPPRISRPGEPRNFDEAFARCPEPLIIELLQSRKWPIDRKVMHKAATTFYRQQVFRAFAVTLAQQRRNILDKARRLLSKHELQRLNIADNQDNLDGQGVVVAIKLREYGMLDETKLNYFFPDSSWLSCRTSVYSLVECNRDAAQNLFDAGFGNVDEADKLGYTPLSVLEIPAPGRRYRGTYTTGTLYGCLGKYFEMCVWYEEKGAQLSRVFGLANTTPLHHIAARVGRYFADIVDFWYSKAANDKRESVLHRFAADWANIVRPAQASVLKWILEETTHHDLYECPCTVGGCLPMNILINETIKTHRSPKEVSQLVVMLLEALCPPDIHENDPMLALIFLRACTFACLNIPHTCGSSSLHRFRRLPEEDREHHFDACVDSWVAEFVAEYHKSGLPLCSFLTESWPKTYEEALESLFEDSLFKMRIGAE
ncbi:hypothetical protein BJX64DRAFT_284434 [Aspergillus heterothallicus]